jgi:shikimate kinase
MPATGKSTIGVILAKLIGYDFLDTDILISIAQKRTLPQIIQEDGYDRFIEIEGEVGSRVKCERTVIATGGSMVFSEKAMRHLAESGVVIWLDTPVSELENRIIGSIADRGVATPVKMTFREIYEMREPLYRHFADIHINCEGTTETLANQLRERLILDKIV